MTRNSYISCLIFITYLVMLGNTSVSECNRCKILSDSFNNWLRKTERGKHEGGDAAWEEAKLKTYSRSEMRLVEIQEGLCSDVKKHQDQCYAVAEEAEHLLEQWWVYEDSNSQDLFIWLCVKTLQYCCPSNHYGALCSPCPIDGNDVVCGGRGFCDGEGTRKGNGTCTCKKGFSGELCESCAENFYSTDDKLCKPCHRACNGCNGEGTVACKSCNSGWQIELGECKDINECHSKDSCKSSQFCVNLEGSYTCKYCDSSCKSCSGEGPENCTLCESNNSLWNGMCLDKTLKQQYLVSVLKRVFLYVLLFILSILLYHKLKLFTSLIILLLGISIYFYEKHTKINILIFDTLL